VALFVGVTMLMTTGLVPMALTTVGNPDIESRVHLPFRELFRASPTGVMACFGIGLSASAYYGLLPSYATHIGISNAELAWLLSGMTIAGFLMQFPIGWLSDRIGRRPLIVAATGVAALVALIISLFPTGAFLISLTAFMVLSAAMAPLYALGVGQTNDYIAREEFVAASAGLLFVWALGATCGPVLAGELMDWLTPHSLFWYLSAAMGAMCLFTIIRIMMRKALSAAAQGNYVPSPITPISACSQGAPALDPRSHRSPNPASEPASQPT
jgi:MFS family permease